MTQGIPRVFPALPYCRWYRSDYHFGSVFCCLVARVHGCTNRSIKPRQFRNHIPSGGKWISSANLGSRFGNCWGSYHTASTQHQSPPKWEEGRRTLNCCLNDVGVSPPKSKPWPKKVPWSCLIPERMEHLLGVSQLVHSQLANHDQVIPLSSPGNKGIASLLYCQSRVTIQQWWNLGVVGVLRQCYTDPISTIPPTFPTVHRSLWVRVPRLNIH